jgi:hypothetical protein
MFACPVKLGTPLEPPYSSTGIKLGECSLAESTATLAAGITNASQSLNVMPPKQESHVAQLRAQ